MAGSQLSTRHELFVAAYVGDAHGNATEAARMAGYQKPAQQGSRLLKNAKIAARIAEHVEQAVCRSEDVLKELADVAFADWRDFVEVIARDKTGKPVKVRMDLTNKVKALELLGKYHSLFVERQKIDIDIREHRVIGVPQDALDAMFQPAPTPELDA